jgi:signal transduction histidine kinase
MMGRPRPLMVDCDPDPLQRVFRQYRGQRPRGDGSAGGQLHVNLAADHVNLRLSFEYTGPGVPTEIRDRIFDAFTTKRAGQRDGLGLTVSQSIIADHDGELTVEQHAHGACFVVTLPVPDRTKCGRVHRKNTIVQQANLNSYSVGEIAQSPMRPHESRLTGGL